jgi:hypothetical protein
MEEEHMLTGHLRAVLALAVDEASSRLYSSSADATVRAWDLSDMSCVAVIRGHSKPVTQLQLLGGRLLFTAAGGGVRVWDTASFVCLAKVKTSFYSGAIRSLLVRARVGGWVRACCSARAGIWHVGAPDVSQARNTHTRARAHTHTHTHIHTRTAVLCRASHPQQVTPDGTVYVGHQDMTVKKYLPLEAAAAGCSGGGTRSSSGGAGGSVPDSIPASPRLTAAGAQQVCELRPPAPVCWLVFLLCLRAAPPRLAHVLLVFAGRAVQGAVRPPDAQTSAWDGHVGPVNDLVACGPYICSAGAWMCVCGVVSCAGALHVA